jgi:uncharacterized membrane protein YuzA (DUF378 family)
VVLTRAFDLLPAWSKALHALALGLVALCTILLIAPAAYHRTVYAGEAAPELHQLGSKFILVATVALALGLAADVYVVIARIAGKAVGFAAAMLALIALVGVWHLAPLVLLWQRHTKARTERQLGTVACTPR